jgi:DNA-binding response OmpR family regulator
VEGTTEQLATAVAAGPAERRKHGDRRKSSRDPATVRLPSNVIVVDTDSERAELLRDVVARRGAHSIYVATGAEAIELIRAGQYACVLVADLSDGSARAFVAWARRHFPTLTLVALSRGAEHSTDLYRAGADHVTQVPVDVELLGAQLGAALRARGHLTLAA